MSGNRGARTSSDGNHEMALVDSRINVAVIHELVQRVAVSKVHVNSTFGRHQRRHPPDAAGVAPDGTSDRCDMNTVLTCRLR